MVLVNKRADPWQVDVDQAASVRVEYIQEEIPSGDVPILGLRSEAA